MASLVTDANAKLSLDKGSFKELKKTKALLPPAWVRHRRYYEEIDCATSPPSLNDSMATLLKSPLDRVAKKDVPFSATEAKDLDGSIMSLASVVSWLDHWLNAFGRLALDPTHPPPLTGGCFNLGERLSFSWHAS